MGFYQPSHKVPGSLLKVLLKYLICLTKDKLDKENNYFEIRSKRAKIIRSRSNFNFLHFTFQAK